MMNKFALRVIAIIFCSISFTFFSSCNDDDGYSLDDMYIYMATVRPIGDNAFDLILDDGTSLWPVNEYKYTPRKNQRAIAYFTLISNKQNGYDHYIVLRKLTNILTKNVIDLTTENQDSIGNDPIKIIRYWIGDDYLNIEFEYKRGGESVHYINLVNNTTLEPNTDNKIHLEFRHNVNGDTQRNGVRGFVAFNLRPYITDNKDSVDFVIKVKDFDKEKEYNLTYKFNDREGKNILTNTESISDATQYK